MTHRVDLNCDLGESYGRWRLGADEQVMALVTSANVACGFHAGDPGTMRRTVELARRHGVAVGAHPGLPDLAGFGRRNLTISPDEAYELALYQIGALDAFVSASGIRMQHVKPHGALYTMAACDGALAAALVEATKAVRRDLIFVGLPSSEMERAATRAGVRFAAEVFADRGYRADGTLVPRGEPGAFVGDANEAARRLVGMVREGRVRSVDGQWVTIRADTACVHGDNPEAVAFAAAIRRALEEAGIEVAPLGGERA